MIEDKIIAAITHHAERVFPLECCGLVIDNGGALQYIECENQSHDPEKSFLIDPVVYAKCADKVKFIVHSHPNRSPQPSEADKASSERAGIPFLIMSYPTCEVSNYYPAGYKTPLEGRPFVYSVMDCFTLVRDFYQQVLNITIPDRQRLPYGWWENSGINSYIMAEYQQWGFAKTDDLKRGDVIVMQLQGQVPNHVAVYLGDGIILHQTLNTTSRQEQYGSYWRKNTVCYLRHNENS